MSDKSIFVNAVCPYCKHKQRVRATYVAAGYKTGIVTCYADDGGCDKEYAIRVTTDVHVCCLSISEPD